ncbi:uncharacterized protein LOC113295473 [Papaver somniferum]|uniref:uncharacterized protein LOC113295473 n=1 Tax=Papaver somniferum TaxID=3469 RepID=UPI000E6FF78E|nr:uncharacterized protein LOC113295473 [Papaver somniferum]
MWVEKTLLALGKTLGTLIVVDKRTLNHEYGHYASVLIDIDFAKLNSDSVYVEAGGRNFLQPFEILKKPKYCFKCKIVDHLDSECRKKHVTAVNTPPVTVSTSKQSNTLVIHQGDANSAWKVAGHKKNVTDELENSEAVLRRATTEFEKAKQAKIAHSVLVDRAKSLSIVSLSTNPVGNVELAIPNPGRIPVSSLSTPVCDALEESSEYISHNKFNILGEVGEPLNNLLLEINKVDEVAKRAKQKQVLALQAKIDALRDNDSMLDSEDSELGIRARKGSSPRLKSSSHTSHQVNISKTQPPKV